MSSPEHLSEGGRSSEDWIDSLRRLMTFDQDASSLVVADGFTAEEAESLRNLVWRANHDSLTMIANRRWFIECAEHARLAAENVGHNHALLVIDLDDFKSVNDTRGHAAGDAVLAEVARRLRTRSRPGDAIGRIGGDEFAVWITQMAPGAAGDLGRRYHRIFDDPILYGEHAIAVGGSIGVLATDGSAPIEDLLDLADRALYDAKAQGPGSVRVYDRTLQDHFDDAVRREQELASAILNDEFVFDVQPIIALSDLEPIGFEVLSRWQSPTRGRLAPAEFLPHLRTGNLIGTFDAMVLEKAARSLRRWRYGLRAPGSLWVNLSPMRLEPSLPSMLRDIIDRHNVEPGELVIELTENFAANTQDRIAVLRALRDLGIKIAIDDFGTGYSQLSYLQEMPIDFVKLDRTFVTGAHAQPRRVAIMRSVIELAHALGAKVVAEGVESELDLELLRALRCDYAQGYHIAQPAAPEQVLGL